MSHRRPHRVTSDSRVVEAIEPRLMLSAAHPKAASHLPHHWTAKPIAVVAPLDQQGPAAAATTATGRKAHGKRKLSKSNPAISPFAGSAAPGGLSPNQVRGAYGLGPYGSSPVLFGSVQGTGAGQTIAIVDAYDYPTAATDLHAFDQQFGLPDPPSFHIVNQTGGTSLPGTDPSQSWELEAALDVQWAHAIAPAANLILFEANDASGNLYTAVQTAAATAGVSAVSMSWGGGEFAGESYYDTHAFVAPAGHPGVTFFAAAGDSGAEAEYPAASPNVVGVGGTKLTVGGSQSGGYTYASETAWSGGGGGDSGYESAPSYQSSVVPTSTSGGYRAVPDVSAVASTQSAVSVYDAYNYGTTTPWVSVGGTSLACPVWAGVVTVANQGRVLAGLGTLNATSQGTHARLYALPASAYHDVTAGSNGHPATAGYDLVTGRGTPVGGTLIADLAGAATVAGRAFVDPNGNGSYDASSTDSPLSGLSVYLDLNDDGVQDNGEPSTTTASDGTYSFSDQPAGGTVRLTSPSVAGYVAVPTVASTAVAYGATSTSDFAYFPTTFTTSADDATYTLQTTSGGATDQVLLDGAVVAQVARSAVAGSRLTFALSGLRDVMVVNAANGNPIPTAGLAVTGAVTPATAAAGSGTTLTLVGTTGNDAFAAAAGSVSIAGTTVAYSGVAGVTVEPNGGTDSLTVNGGRLAVAATAAGGVARPFSTLSVAAGATLAFARPAAHADRAVVVVAGTFSVNGTLDLGGNDLIVRNGTASQLNGLLADGGLVSSAAAADPNHLTTLGLLPNQDANGTPIYGGSGEPTFDGQPTSTADVLVKYTYFGDANLDGTVNGSDYVRLDAGYAQHLTGWADGDFNFDGAIDGSDYTLIDNAFNIQATTS